MSTPQEQRIRLRMEGMPQAEAEGAALVLVLALKYCQQAEVFPALMEWARTDNEGTPWVLKALGKLQPAHLMAVEHMISAGIVADMEAAS